MNHLVASTRHGATRPSWNFTKNWNDAAEARKIYLILTKSAARSNIEAQLNIAVKAIVAATNRDLVNENRKDPSFKAKKRYSRLAGVT